MVESSVKQATTRSKLFKILDFLDDHLPCYCEVHGIVLAALSTRNPSYRVYYYDSQSSESNYKAIVGIKQDRVFDPSSHVGEGASSWMLTEFHTDEDLLIQVYDAIPGINWKKDFIFLIGSKSLGHLSRVLKYIKDRHDVKGEQLIVPCPVNRYYINIPTALKIEIKIPEEVYVKSLERRHAVIVHEHWPYKQISSVEDVADEIDQLPSAGVFLKETDQLVSWTTGHFGFGSIARLFTLESYRRRGYAKLAVQYTAKRAAQAGYIPEVGVLTYNTAANSFFHGLENFKFLKKTSCLEILPRAAATSNKG